MSQAYTDPERENDPYALPDLEVFPLDEDEIKEWNDDAADEDSKLSGPGWYYWNCFPGCLPDSEPIGPFDSEDEALEDACENAGVYDE